jgi:hypothetical protein
MTAFSFEVHMRHGTGGHGQKAVKWELTGYLPATNTARF